MSFILIEIKSHLTQKMIQIFTVGVSAASRTLSHQCLPALSLWSQALTLLYCLFQALLGFDWVCTTLHQWRRRPQQGQFLQVTPVDVIEGNVLSPVNPLYLLLILHRASCPGQHPLVSPCPSSPGWGGESRISLSSLHVWESPRLVLASRSSSSYPWLSSSHKMCLCPHP